MAHNETLWKYKFERYYGGPKQPTVSWRRMVQKIDFCFDAFKSDSLRLSFAIEMQLEVLVGFVISQKPTLVTAPPMLSHIPLYVAASIGNMYVSSLCIWVVAKRIH